MVKFIQKHNHPLSTTQSKSRLHRSQSIVHSTSIVHHLICNLNSEAIGPSNIARVCNATGDWPEQKITTRQCGRIVRRGRVNNVEESV